MQAMELNYVIRRGWCISQTKVEFQAAKVFLCLPVSAVAKSLRLGA